MDLPACALTGLVRHAPQTKHTVDDHCSYALVRTCHMQQQRDDASGALQQVCFFIWQHAMKAERTSALQDVLQVGCELPWWQRSRMYLVTPVFGEGGYGFQSVAWDLCWC